MSTKPYILFADDDTSAQLTVSKYLQENFELVCINNYGRDCLESINDRRPDLIILGTYMNLYYERQTHEFLRSKNEFQAIPIISIYTKISESENDRYIALPLNKESLLIAINQLLNNQIEKEAAY